MNIECGEVGVMGVYYFELNGVPVFELPSKNLITDFGWNRLSNLGEAATNANAVCQVGTSNTTPTTGDVALGALLASKTGAGFSTEGTGSDGTGSYSFSRFPFVFAQGAVVGNVAEVGFKVASADASLTSRSLVKDAGGNPTTITVTAIDQLTVQYEIRYYRAALNVTSSVTVNGVPTTYILRTATAVAGTSSSSNTIGGLNPSSASSFNHYGTGSTFGAAGVDVSGTNDFVGTLSATSKVITVNPTNTVVTFTTGVIPVGTGNSSGGVQNIQFQINGNSGGVLGAYGTIKANFSPAIPKNNTNTLSYSFSFTFTRL